MKDRLWGKSVLAGLLALVGACAGTRESDGRSGADGGACVAGATRCDGNVLQTCAGDGTYADSETCPMACDDQLGCVVCEPGTGTCDGEVSHACKADGSGWEDVLCDGVQGMSCGTSGVCEGACSPKELGQSYIGCEYYPTITGNMVGNAYSFAVAVANTADVPASIHIEGGALSAPMTFTVAANSVEVEYLPWRTDLKLCNGQNWESCSVPGAMSSLAAGGAYHLRSDVPVTVYQFNPLDYYLPSAGQNAYTNDASLLFPTTAWSGSYLVASWERASSSPSLVSVTASQDGTSVTINVRAETAAQGGAPGFARGVPQSVTLNRGDVLEIGTTQAGPAGDLTGSLVEADKPVQVIGAHYCANVPTGVAYCDHLEESMFPIAALSTRYLVNAPAVTTIPNGKEEVVRIIATAPNTTLTYDPPQAGAPTSIAAAGDFAEISRQAASYMVSASNKVMVVQYMEGSQAGGGTGDPAMALAVPVDQFRTEYLFHAPTNYETNYVDITAEAGTVVMLDGAPVTSWVPIGSTGYSLARITPLGAGPGGDGNHVITGASPFGITVYGYGQDTSYWYPGGLDLVDIPVE